MGAILDMAIRDARRIVKNGGFNQSLIIIPTGKTPVTIQGLATRHSDSFDTDGLPISAENVHCTFSEKDLNDLSVVTRNSSGDLAIKNWLVQFADDISTNTYKISETFPDKILGLIRCTLSLYE